MRSTNSQQDIFQQDVYFTYNFKNAMENQEINFLPKYVKYEISAEMQNRLLN